MLPWPLAVIGVVVTILLAVGAALTRAITPTGSAVAAVFGIVIVVFAGFPYLALLILFVVASVLATRFRFSEKRQRNLQEGKAGERGVSNVVAHIILPTWIAVAGGVSPPLTDSATTSLLFASALAFGGADTFASEFGVLAGKARSILTGKPVPAGTNGGVSLLGEGFALFAAALTAVVGAGLFLLFGTPITNLAVFVIAVTTAGFLGCQIDSILGETLENRGVLTKGGVNFLGMLSAIAIGWTILSISGGRL